LWSGRVRRHCCWPWLTGGNGTLMAHVGVWLVAGRGWGVGIPSRRRACLGAG
jgi:hypothetical protein